jgi:hypothetical protein
MLNGLVLALMIAYVTVWDCQRLQPYESLVQLGESQMVCALLTCPKFYSSPKERSLEKALDVINNLRYYLVT